MWKQSMPWKVSGVGLSDVDSFPETVNKCYRNN